MELGPSRRPVGALVLFVERGHVRRIWSQGLDESKDTIRCRGDREMVGFREPGMSTCLVDLPYPFLCGVNVLAVTARRNRDV